LQRNYLLNRTGNFCERTGNLNQLTRKAICSATVAATAKLGACGGHFFPFAAIVRTNIDPNCLSAKLPGPVLTLALMVAMLSQSGEARLRGAAFIGIFFAVKRRNMRWILVEIRACDPKLFFVRVGPLPQDFTRRASLRTCLALHAHGIGRKPMAIATAAAPAMV
jgi:hypothetical protein